MKDLIVRNIIRLMKWFFKSTLLILATTWVSIVILVVLYYYGVKETFSYYISGALGMSFYSQLKKTMITIDVTSGSAIPPKI